MIFRNWPCFDCGVDTSDEYYCVDDQLWRSAALARGDEPTYLCLGCLERRLGFELCQRDLEWVARSCSPRLSNRLLRLYRTGIT